MKVILQQDIRGKGKKGEMIEAAEGYARNYLLPRKLAVPATPDAINTMNLKEAARRKRRKRRTAPPPWPPRISCGARPSGSPPREAPAADSSAR